MPDARTREPGTRMADLESSRCGAALLAVGFGFKGSGSRDVVLRRACPQRQWR